MKPIRNFVLVKPFPPDEVSEGGIFVPESARQESNKVHIIAVGNGTKNKPMNLKAGQVGYRVKDWGTLVEIDGVKHYLMDNSAIIAIEE
jgi:chaperonin GroES